MSTRKEQITHAIDIRMHPIVQRVCELVDKELQDDELKSYIVALPAGYCDVLERLAAQIAASMMITIGQHAAVMTDSHVRRHTESMVAAVFGMMVAHDRHREHTQGMDAEPDDKAKAAADAILARFTNSAG